MKNRDIHLNIQIPWILYANAVTTLSPTYKYTMTIVTVSILHFTRIPKCMHS